MAKARVGPDHHSYKHGGASHGRRTPEYKSWDLMKSRCYNPHDRSYARYGGRGITVCKRWRYSFANFLADMGPRPSPRHSLDRFPDQNGNYEPGNCRWATRKQQANNRHGNRLLTHEGLTLTTSQWSERLGMPRYLLYLRFRLGWSVAAALTTPKAPRTKR